MKGAFILSVDLELAWGFVGNKNIDRLLSLVSTVRKNLDPFLTTVEKHRTPVSWAITGHLFLDRCTRNGRPHIDMPRPNYGWFEGDWYKYDPCSDIDINPLWYGKDIVEKLLLFSKESAAEQDIGCHSFSHQIFGDPGCSEELARAELDKCLAIMAGYGIRPKTFVFPIGSVGHVNVLKEKGFNVYRGRLVERFPRYASLEKSAKNMLRKRVALMDEFLSYYSMGYPPVVLPRQVLPGLWDVPGSMGFGRKSGVPRQFVVLKAKRGIQRAIKEKKCFHIFTHLHNFGRDSATLLEDFDSILSLVAREREKGNLLTVNMQQCVHALGN